MLCYTDRADLEELLTSNDRLEYIEESNTFHELLQELQELMDTTNTKSLTDLYEYCVNEANTDNTHLKKLASISESLLEDPKIEIFAQDEYIESLEKEMCENFQNYDDTVKYAHIIIDMIKKDLPGSNCTDQTLLAQIEAVKEFKILMDDYHLKINEIDPEEFVNILYYAKNQEMPEYTETCDNFFQCYDNFANSPYQKQKLLISTVSTAPTPLLSSNNTNQLGIPVGAKLKCPV
jgi:hypothetical protein